MKTLFCVHRREINEGQNEVHLNPLSWYRGSSERAAKQNERLSTSLHSQCCNVRNATQCHLKPTGTVAGLKEKKQRWHSWGSHACLPQHWNNTPGSCNTSPRERIHFEGRFSEASGEDIHCWSKTTEGTELSSIYLQQGAVSAPFFCSHLASSFGSLMG